MAIQESGEMYLETILVLSIENDKVRAIDICDKMGFSKPSVSRALGLLKDDGYVVVDEKNLLTLTEEGRKVAEKIYERHTTLMEFFVALGVSEAVAEEDACRIEHVISDETFNKMKEHMEIII